MLIRALLAAVMGATTVVGGELPAELGGKYVAASKHLPRVGEALSISVGVAGTVAGRAAINWPEREIKWVFERADGTQRNQDTLPAAGTAKDHASITLRQEGVTMIGLDFKPRDVTLNEAQLGELLKRFPDVSADRKSDAAAKPGTRVRHESSATALIRSVDSNEPSAIATSKSGQRAEIRPFLDPTLMKIGGDLPLKVYADGDKAAGARVRIVPPQGDPIEQLSNPSGMVTIAIGASGVWRVEMEQLILAKHEPEVDWVFYTSSLTFEVPAAGAEKAGTAK